MNSESNAAFCNYDTDSYLNFGENKYFIQNKQAQKYFLPKEFPPRFILCIKHCYKVYYHSNNTFIISDNHKVNFFYPKANKHHHPN